MMRPIRTILGLDWLQKRETALTKQIIKKDVKSSWNCAVGVKLSQLGTITTIEKKQQLVNCLGEQADQTVTIKTVKFQPRVDNGILALSWDCIPEIVLGSNRLQIIHEFKRPGIVCNWDAIAYWLDENNCELTVFGDYSTDPKDVIIGREVYSPITLSKVSLVAQDITPFLTKLGVTNPEIIIAFC